MGDFLRPVWTLKEEVEFFNLEMNDRNHKGPFKILSSSSGVLHLIYNGGMVHGSMQIQGTIWIIVAGTEPLPWFLPIFDLIF